MGKANDNQVGGSHYAKGGAVQHWDWVESNGVGYLEACATKYVTRFRAKNGMQDLEKALHYVTKLHELSLQVKSTSAWWGMVEVQEPSRSNRAHIGGISTHEFARANDLDELQYQVCYGLLRWTEPGHLTSVIEVINMLMNIERKASC